MNVYIGSKIIRAKPMTRLEYNELRGWTVPTDENPADEGYLVEYLDGGQSNMPGYAGYVSWSPADVFDRAYRDVKVGMTFGDALEMLKAGHRVARAGWNGKGMWLLMVAGGSASVVQGAKAGPDDLAGVFIREHIVMRPADGGKYVPWLASQTDMLASDWIIV